jgi:hypothetical protein
MLNNCISKWWRKIGMWGPRATSPQKRWLLVVDNKLTIIMVTPLILSYYILWLI